MSMTDPRREAEGCAELRLPTLHPLSLSGPRGLLRCVVALHIYVEGYIKRFTVTQCSKKLVTMHNVLLRIREDLGPSLLHASLTELPTHNKGRGTTHVKP